MTRIAGCLAWVCLYAQDENPEWKYWSTCKAGSRAKYMAEMELEGKAVIFTSVRTLAEIGADKAVVKEETEQVGPDGKTDVDEDKIAVEKAKPSLWILKELGTEEIEVKGKKLKCRVAQVHGGAHDPPKKMWLSAEIPGGVVKAESLEADKDKYKVTLVEYEKK